jgi:ribosomal protein L19E
LDDSEKARDKAKKEWSKESEDLRKELNRLREENVKFRGKIEELMRENKDLKLQ